ncbi:hypothetical protein [Pseudofrankia sp. BMG5.37]|uniref:hypothetical protein n=1 Tax=Pseudofrankia sp. BMG5.37 TaxID=3050035 RepID=UPI0028956768|nr:hypothetical protein [Pseudofrankia sp. BMG5.37]MDT3444011.1 hypothetical protein [Pseudofrankia sp. BMG5.37]
MLGQPWERLRGEVDLLVGFTRDEYRFFTTLLEGLTKADPAATAERAGLPASALLSSVIWLVPCP